jgi:DNA-binding GntR family transcriptional regulator
LSTERSFFLAEIDRRVSECRAGNVKKAARLLRQHILTAGDALVSLLRERQQATDLSKV